MAAEAAGGTAVREGSTLRSGCCEGTTVTAWCHPGNQQVPVFPLAGLKAEPDPFTAELKNHSVICVAACLYHNRLQQKTWQPFDVLWLGIVPRSLRGECNTIYVS